MGALKYEGSIPKHADRLEVRKNHVGMTGIPFTSMFLMDALPVEITQMIYCSVGDISKEDDKLMAAIKWAEERQRFRSFSPRQGFEGLQSV